MGLLMDGNYLVGQTAVGLDQVATKQIESFAQLPAFTDDAAGETAEPSVSDRLGGGPILLFDQMPDSGGDLGQIEGFCQIEIGRAHV